MQEKQTNMLRLSDLNNGESAKIVSLAELDTTSSKKLIDRGMLRGEKIKLVRCAPLGDPLCLEVKGYQLVLRRETAAKIIVERIG